MNHGFPSCSTRRRFLAAGAGALLPLLKAPAAEEPLSACISAARWAQVEQRVDKILAIISRSQQPGGALGMNYMDAQPAATSVSIMAFLSRGHAPGRGRYGACLERAIDYVLSTQDRSGVFSLNGRSKEGTYHHVLTGLMLGEVYGLTGNVQALRLREAIIRALVVSRQAQLDSPEGTAMRYLHQPYDADLSVTGGYFLFFRSAKNAEFDVPEKWITQMLTYVNQCVMPGGDFGYRPNERPSLAMAGIGLIFLAMTGRQHHPLAVATAKRILAYDYKAYMRQAGYMARRDYCLYYASIAMSQMGGQYWRAFFPRLVDAQLNLPETDTGLLHTSDNSIGPVLSNAFVVLTLTPPCQVLPIYQR